ncbi:hypothetical protein MHLP_01075 [Candidatus Mycoplasma haematolamae str. Purdue]|uniref:Uncharacterized protein n=1 Tax=Mycoplasma haematolamae (strain Purdue) TaxID=1212765 RepID=I7B949_MYCHA|nr:hypothetical protein [Candidatus Mycoplasma haematolamae]AFO51795.1 hypothetical protein MHLP_01075 [Candidatus Mycoplasma haematolamae str. Purdue]
MLHLKTKLALVVLGLGGANGVSMLVFKDDLFQNLRGTELKELFSSLGPFSGNNSLDLRQTTRENLGTLGVSNLSSPVLSLYADGQLNIGSLGNAWGFKEQITKFQESNSSLEASKLKDEKARKIIGQLSKSDIQHFLKALEKIERFARGENNVEALDQQERRVVLKYYKVWCELKQIGLDITAIFSKEGEVAKLQQRDSFEDYESLKKKLSKLGWEWPSLKVLGLHNRFVDASRDWGSVRDWDSNQWREYYVRDSHNWGYDLEWSKNPWKDFFVDEAEWKVFWRERSKLKERLWRDWHNSKSVVWWDYGCFKPVNGVEFFEGCYETTQKELAEVIDGANANIGLQVGMKTLLWMGYPLQGKRAIIALNGRNAATWIESGLVNLKS